MDDPYHPASSSSSSSTASSKMRRVFSSNESTKDVIARYQNSMQQLVDAMHQVQKDVKCLTDNQSTNFAVQRDRCDTIHATLRELNKLSTTKAEDPIPGLRLDLQEGFEEVLDNLQNIVQKQAHLLQEAQARRTNSHLQRRARPVGLIEGVFRALDLLLMKGFTRVADKHCGV